MAVKLGSVQHQLKALLIVVVVSAIVVAALRPTAGLVILMVLAPFEVHFYGTGSNELLLVAIALVLLWRVRAAVIPAWVSIGAVSLVLGSLVSAIGAHSQATALWGALRWLSALVVLGVALSVLRERRNASRRMVDLFTGSAVVVVIFALTQRAGIYAIVGAPFISDHPSSFFSYYTNYAGYAAMAATLATGEVLAALRERESFRVATYGAALLFIILGLVISASRGGVLALAGGWLALLVFNFRRGSVLVQMIAVLAILIAAAYVVVPPSAIVTIQQRFAAPPGSLPEDRTRFAVQKAGEQALLEYPGGIGFGNFPAYVRANVRSGYVQLAFSHAQNTPLQIGLDASWLGLLAFMLLFAWPIGLVLVRARGGSSTVRASAFAAALVGFMTQGLFDYLFYEIDFLIFFVAMVWGTIHALSVDDPSLVARRPLLGIGVRHAVAAEP